METMYNGFAEYFSRIINTTKRKENEEKLMADLLSYLRIGNEEPILDAACGSGEALYSVYQHGYYNLQGLDSSGDMIALSKEKLPDIPFHTTRWEELNHYPLHAQFRLLYLISVSLLHAKEEDFPTIFNSFFNLLSETGVLLLDVRKWDRLENGELVEPNRPTGQYKKICEFTSNNQQHTVEDICTYEQERQHVTYKIESRNLQGEYEQTRCYPVSYARISAEKIQKYLLAAGFKRVERLERAYWPYLLILAYKK